MTDLSSANLDRLGMKFMVASMPLGVPTIIAIVTNGAYAFHDLQSAEPWILASAITGFIGLASWVVGLFLLIASDIKGFNLGRDDR